MNESNNLNLDLYDLTDREKHMILLRYRLSLSSKGATPTARGLLPYAAIGAELGLSKQRIHQILEKALRKLSDPDKEKLRILAIPEPPEGNLSAKIKQKRLLKNMPREALATALGTSVSYVGSIENATEAPSIAMIRKIAHALDIKPKELLQGL